MNCQRCNSDKILNFSAKCSDQFSCTYKGEGYRGLVPQGIGINDQYGDFVEGDLCLNCGQVQGKFPLPDPKLIDEEGEYLRGED